MPVKFGNNAATLLAANASSSTTTLIVDDGAVFPTLSGADYTYITLEDAAESREVVKLTAVSGNTLTVVRAQDGTSARAFAIADKCELRITAALLNGIAADINGGTINGTTIGATTPASVAATTGTFSGEIAANGGIALGDNDKATFGAGDDLEISHTGTDSFIKDVGTGSLYLGSDGAGVNIYNPSTSEFMAKFNVNSDVKLYYDNAQKLATTATGIDVTGTVTADGLTVAGTTTLTGDFNVQDSSDYNVEFRGTSSSVSSISLQSRFRDDTNTSYWGGANIQFVRDGNWESSITFDTSPDYTNRTGLPRLNIASNGDISFYEDTGTTAKFFWDASAESLTVPTLTTTGIDVTGTVTADGLTVDGPAFVNLTSRPSGIPATAGALWAAQTETGNYGISIRASTTDSFTYIGNTGSTATLGQSYGSTGSYLPLVVQTSDLSRLKVETNGDISFYEDTGTTAKFFWDASAESLGIGGTPNYKLNVLSDAGAQNIFQAAQSGVSNGFSITSDGSALTYSFLTGNVGIGTSSPTAPLTVNGGTASAATIQLGNHNDNASIHGKYSLSFKADSTEAIADRSISFAIGTAANFALTTSSAIFNDLGADIDFRVESDSNTHALFVDAGNSYVNLNSSATPDSSVAGFMFTADQLFTSAGAATTLNYQVRFYNGNGLVGAITTDGSATAYLTSSDQRLKENIADAPDAGDLIDAIQVRQFDWKADGEHQRYGMVAQELNAVAPEAVSAPEDPDEMMGVDYSKLVPMMLKEIQSLRARISQLEGAN